MRALVIGAAVAACLALFAPPASASFPGRNGSIAFSSLRHGSFDIYLVSPGGALQPLTHTSKVNETSPA